MEEDKNVIFFLCMSFKSIIGKEKEKQKINHSLQLQTFYIMENSVEHRTEH